ncbi:hypothetical protein ACWEOE_11015 [Amycolatopsis sp. NPDC004368]
MTRSRMKLAVKRHLHVVPALPRELDPAHVRAILAPRRLSLVRPRGAA